jgi:hypothetical protein
VKNNLLLLLACLVFASCAGKKANPKAALDSVLGVHDKVMGADEQVVKNKIALDSIIKTQKLSPKDTAFMLRNQLAVADSAMDNWMHGFEPDQKGKTDVEKVAYFTIQKKQILAIDSQLNTAIGASGKYLVKIKKK